MKWISLVLLLSFSVYNLVSFDFGGALSTSYYNNPMEDSAPSPIQYRPEIFQSFYSGFFNLRYGVGITDANYEINDWGIPVFNDIYAGFYTIEFDLFLYPGLLFPIGSSFSLGLAAGGGARLPVVTKVDDEVVEGQSIDADRALMYFYDEYRYVFWGGQLFCYVKLPMDENVQFYGNIHYRDFPFRKDEWIVGATVGLLWHL